MNESGKSKFKSFIPILKDREMLYSLYELSSQFSLEKFLEKRNINLSIEEIENLWDIIEACRAPQIKNSLMNLGKDETNSKNKLDDNDLNISGGIGEFCNKAINIATLIENMQQN